MSTEKPKPKRNTEWGIKGQKLGEILVPHDTVLFSKTYEALSEMKARKTTGPAEKWAEVMGGSQNKKCMWSKRHASVTVRDMSSKATQGYKFSSIRLEKRQKFDKTLCCPGAREVDTVPLSRWVYSTAHMRVTASKMSDGLSPASVTRSWGYS